MMSKQILVGLTMLVAVAATGCRKQEVAPAETAATAEQARLEGERQEAARRVEEATALEGRLAAVSAAVAEMKSVLGAGQGPVALEQAMADLEASLESPRQLLAELQAAQGDSWNGVRDRLAEALGALEQQSQSAAASAADWKRRQEAAREARREMTLPMTAKGLIEGLDGGDYEPYLVPVVERVQRRLRAEGLYAGEADGYFDVTTREAVGRFQEKEELAVSGVPSPMTRARLFAD